VSSWLFTNIKNLSGFNVHKLGNTILSSVQNFRFIAAHYSACWHWNPQYCV